MATGEHVFAPLERLRSTLFLAAGTILIPFVVSLFIIGILNAAPQDVTEYRVFAGVGFPLAFLGFLGLYPELVVERPWLTRGGGVFAILGAVTWSLEFVTVGLPSVPHVAETALGPVFFPIALLGLLLGPLLFGLASLGSGVHSRQLGMLMLVPSLVWGVNITRFLVFGADPWALPWVLLAEGGAQCLSMLAIGYLLRMEAASTDPTRSPVDSPA